MYYWYKVYSTLLLKYWYHMTPMQYGYMLIAIAAIGYFFMKGSVRR